MSMPRSHHVHVHVHVHVTSCHTQSGQAPGQFYQPRGVVFARGWLVVTEAKRVSVLAPDGELRQVSCFVDTMGVVCVVGVDVTESCGR